MTTNGTPIFQVRLDHTHRTMAAETAAALATALHPTVTLADVIRHAIREVHGKFVTSAASPMAPIITPTFKA